MKAPYIPHRFLLVSATVAAAGLAVSGGATTFYFGSSSSSAYADYGNPNNWFLDQACTTPAGSIPTASDSLRPYNYHYMDFGGNEYSIGSLDWPSGSWQYRFYMKNGGLLFTGSPNPHYEGFYLEENASLRFSPNTSFTPGYNDGGCFIISVKNGSSFEFDNAAWNIHHVEVRNRSGGTVYFNPSELGVTGHNFDAPIKNESGASMTLPSGIVCSKGQNGHIQLQNSGTLTIGGPLSYGSTTTKFSVTFSGGTVNVTGNVSTKLTAASFSGATAMTFVNGALFDASIFTAESGASVTLTGSGTLVIPAAPPALSIGQGMTIELGASGATDLSSATFASGTHVKVGVANGRIDIADASIANATFTADLASVTAGSSVFSSMDAALLAKAKTELLPLLPQGLTLVESGDTLMVEAVSDYIFDSTSVTDLLNGAGWNTGSVPPDNVDVQIDGTGVVATYSSGAIPAWTSIEVKNGAILRMSADAVLPEIKLNKNATLDIAAGMTSLSTLIGVVHVAGDSVTLPVLSIQTNATLTIGGDMKFKNVDFRLYGKLSKSSTTVKGPTFGYAAGGETSYFAFTSDGGNFDIHSETGSDPTLGQLNFLCPESGGTVVAVGPITLRNSTHRINGWNDMGNVYFGNGNPMTEPFDVLIDNTKFDISGNFRADGATHLTLANGSYIRRDVNCLGHGFNMAIGYAATVEIGEGCYIDFTTYNGAGSFGMDVQSAVDAVTVRDGGVYNVTYHSSGWGQGVFVADGGILGVSRIADSRVRTDLLRGFGSARLDGDLAIAALEMRTGGHFTNTVRQAKVANIPFTGTGNVIVTNGVPTCPFSVTMVNGASTATGSIGVAPIEGAGTTLYFGDGANWAGTVKANGDVKLVKSFAAVTDATADAPAAVSFGGVELLDDTFKLRLWEDGTCDTINIGANGWTGTGKLDFEFVGGFEPAAQAWKVATQPAEATLPAVKKATFALTTQASATEGFVDVYLKVANGVVILLR